MLQKREKVLLLKTFQGRTLRIVREHYLRPSVPCNSPLCPQPATCRNGQGPGGSEGGRARTRGARAGRNRGGEAGAVRPVRRKGTAGGGTRGPGRAESKARQPPSALGFTSVPAASRERGGGPRAAETAVVCCFWGSPRGTPRLLRPMRWEGPETVAPTAQKPGDVGFPGPERRNLPLPAPQGLRWRNREVLSCWPLGDWRDANQ